MGDGRAPGCPWAGTEFRVATACALGAMGEFELQWWGWKLSCKGLSGQCLQKFSCQALRQSE